MGLVGRGGQRLRAINELIEHGVAANLRHATRISILAGIDIDMHSDLAYLVETGEVPLEVVDAAVRRVLAVKFLLGLFSREPIDAGRPTEPSSMKMPAR